jgi:hypothetical protein
LQLSARPDASAECAERGRCGASADCEMMLLAAMGYGEGASRLLGQAADGNVGVSVRGLRMVGQAQVAQNTHQGRTRS